MSVELSIAFKSETYPFPDRAEADDLINDALVTAGLGEVTGGGSGGGSVDIDVTVTDLDRGLALIRKILLEAGCPDTTVIHQFEPEHVVHSLK